MTILYFAWVRDIIGKDSESLQHPPHLETVADLLDWLECRSPAHAAALSDRSNIRTALDQDFAEPETLLGAATEVAIFPPVTGG